MGSWRSPKGKIYHQEVQGTISHSRKPPLGSWQPRVPSWEKKFCSSVGLVPWAKVVEAKRFMYLYENVLQWNDSAGEEAFSNAKKRYWARINGVPCDISLPNPDEYIDEVDWNLNVDPELLLDLEHGPRALSEENNNDGVIFGSALVNQSFACKGWGDEEDGWKEDTKLCSGPGARTHERNVDEWKDTWENSYPENKVANDGGGDQWNESCGWNDLKNNDLKPGWSDWENYDFKRGWNGWENHDAKPGWDDWGDHVLTSGWNDGGNNGWNQDKSYNNLEKFQYGAPGDWNSRSREAAALCSSRYKTARFHGSDRRINHGWRHNRGVKRNNFAY